MAVMAGIWAWCKEGLSNDEAAFSRTDRTVSGPKMFKPSLKNFLLRDTVE